MELLERSSYLHELDGLLRLAIAGRGRMLFLGGEAGVGKSVLVRHFAEQVNADTRVLIGTCDPLSTPRPLEPLLDICDLMGYEVPALIHRSAPRMELFREVLRDLAENESSLLIFEDAHWADEATLDLIRYLGRRIGQTPALMIVTYRDDEVGPSHPMRQTLGDLSTADAVRRLTLRPLSLDGVTELAAGSAIDPPELHQLTRGNPFYVTEVLALGEPGLPPSVRDAVLARASRLSVVGRKALDACAIIGPTIDPGLLDQVSDSAAAIVESLDLGILTTNGSNLAFRHELARQAMLEAISPVARLDLHRQVLAVLQEAEVHDAARLAHHAEEAGDRDAVLEYAVAAAKQAESVSAHREAAEQYARALRFADDQSPEWKADLLKARARECVLTGQNEEQLSAVTEELAIWQELGNSLRVGDALCRLANAYWVLGDNEKNYEALDACVEALESLPPGKELASAYKWRSGAAMLAWRTDEAIFWGDRATALAEKLGDADTMVNALNSVGCARLVRGDARGEEELRRSLELALQHGFDGQVGRAYTNLASSLCYRFRFTDAETVFDDGIPYCSEHDLSTYWSHLLSWRSNMLMHQGNWSVAADLASSLLRNPTLAPYSRIVALVTLGTIRLRQGDSGASTLLDSALEAALLAYELQRLGPVRATRAESAWLSGGRSEILDEVLAVYDEAMSSGAPDIIIGQLVFWRWRAGDLAEPPDNAFEPFALQIAGNWKAAAARWREMGCPYEAASALYDSDDEADLRYALAEFTRLGAQPMEQKTRQKLREMGAVAVARGPRPSTRANPAGLTEREAEVMQLVAEELTNAEIADRLFVSPRTVEHHVASILAKLNVTTRTDAVSQFQSQHPEPPI